MSKNVSILLLVSSILLIALNIYLLASKPKIGFVRSQDLVYQFQGMKEARQKFEELKLRMTSNLDTLKLHYQQSLASLQQSSENQALLRAVAEDELNAIVEQSRGIEQELKREEEIMLSGVLDQVNEYCEKYGKQNGYTAILGTTMSGSLLYGDEAVDITEDVLVGLNETYSGN